MRIVVLDGYTENPGDISWKELSDLGELEVYDRSSVSEAITRSRDAEIILTNKTPITAEMIDACHKLKYISVLATGFNIVDVSYATSKGIPVSNVPSYGTASVAQYSIALLREICHHIGYHAQTVSDGRWTESKDFCYWDYPLLELASKTIGIIGFGRIGQAEGRIAKALGMRVLAFDPVPNATGREIAAYVSFDELLSESDVVSLHCDLNNGNMGIINKQTIKKMKDGVILINNARGQLIQEQDVADALESGKIAAAGLDVVSTEPILKDNPLLRAKNCIITPHISWASKECRQRIMQCTVDNVRNFMAGKPTNVVNR